MMLSIDPQMKAILTPENNDAHPGPRTAASTAVGGIPLLLRQIHALAKEGVTWVTIAAREESLPIQDPILAEAQSLGIVVDIVAGRVSSGTAACRMGLDRIEQDVVIITGGVLFDIALRPLRDFHHRRDAYLTVVAQPCLDPRGSDLVRERNGFVSAFLARERRQEDERNLAPTGIYVAAPSLFRHPAWRGGSTAIRDLVPRLLSVGAPIGCYRTSEYIRALNSPAQCITAARDLADGRLAALRLDHKRPAIIFDCDGVLNEERPRKGVLRPNEVKLIPGAADAVRRARAAGFLTVAITNRAQVARGEITFEQLDHIVGRLEALLAAEGGLLDRIYVCPHHPAPGNPGAVAELAVACECRKPGALLFHQALAELPIDAARSVVIGDSLRDIGAARKAGLAAYGVRTGYGCTDVDRYPGGASPAPAPHLLFADVGAAIDFVLSGQRQLDQSPSRTGRT